MTCVCVDDEPFFLDQMSHMISDIREKNDVDIEVKAYQDPESLLVDLEDKKQYDLYLIDIELQDSIDGLELAFRIREYDEKGKIVFLTSHTEFSLRGYDVKAYHYILKNQMDKLEHVLDEIVQSMKEEEGQFIIVKGKNRYEKIWYSDIQYVYKEGKDSIFVESDGRKVSMRSSLYKVFEQMKSSQMLLCGKSYIINMDRIKRLDGQDIIFDTNESIRIGRPQKQTIQKAIYEFWREQRK